MLRSVPLGICLSVRAANHRSAMLSQDALVGVKCRWKRGRLRSQRWMTGVFVRREIVEHQVNFQLLRNAGVDGVQELLELGRSVATVHLTNDVTRLGVERCEQRRGAVTDVIMEKERKVAEPKYGEFVFLNEDGTPVYTKNVNKRFQAHVARIGLPDIPSTGCATPAPRPGLGRFVTTPCSRTCSATRRRPSRSTSRSWGRSGGGRPPPGSI